LQKTTVRELNYLQINTFSPKGEPNASTYTPAPCSIQHHYILIFPTVIPSSTSLHIPKHTVFHAQYPVLKQCIHTPPFAPLVRSGAKTGDEGVGEDVGDSDVEVVGVSDIGVTCRMRGKYGWKPGILDGTLSLLCLESGLTGRGLDVLGREGCCPR
jgi:hypothetical protein